jgi:hypothetical protein
MEFHLPKKSAVVTKSPYEALGLTDLPFPNDPVVDLYSPDPRQNGSIYAESTAKEAIAKFEQMLIRPNDFPNRVRLAYLWSKGDSESGRGVGKTALLRYFRHRINRDLGHTEFGGRFSAVVVYVSFKKQVDRRFIEQLALSGLVDICRNDVLKQARAALRLERLKPEQVEAVTMGPDGVQEMANLLNDDVFREKGLKPEEVDRAVADRLTSDGIQPAVAQAFATGNFDGYLRSLRKDGNLEPLYVPRDTRILDLACGLLFNDVVHFLRAAGFAGGYLFIDDIENLVDQMARKDRIEFAKEFGLCTVRPGYANTAHKFFSCVLTTHQQASVALSQAWGEAGLSAIARLDPGSPNSVELPFPTKDQAREIIIAHLDAYRPAGAERHSIEPFTEDGLDALLQNRQTVHPRDMLSRAATVFRYAAEKGITAVDAACVNTACQSATAVGVPDVTEGIDGAM